MSDNRRILTWTLNASNTPYDQMVENSNAKGYRYALNHFAHKIYSIGCHDFGVRSNGDVYDFKTSAAPNYNYYFDASGNDRGVRMPINIRNDMVKYPHIQWYLQMIIFGPRTLFGWDGSDGDPANVGLFDSPTAIDNFINQLKKIVPMYQQYGIDGIEMDVEASMTDSYYTNRTGDDVKYINLLKRVKNEVCIPNNLKMRVNAHAMWGNNYPNYYRFHNYKLMAEATDNNGNALIDEIQLMTYDFAWSGSAPGASTPLWWFDQVAEWCITNFDKSRNPNAKLTMDKLFFGAAGYGNRWGLFNENVIKKGSSITFKNLLGWQNGLYRHFTTRTDGSGNTQYVYENQDYIPQNGFEDQESKNQIMYPHIYDYWKAEFMNVKQFNGEFTGKRSKYNGKGYITSYSRSQYSDFGGVKAIVTNATVTGKVAVTPNATKKTIDDPDVPVTFNGYTFNNPRFDPAVEYITDPDTGKTTANFYCKADTVQGKAEFRFNVPTSGSYHLVALVSFPFFDQQRLNGTFNGASLVVGGNIANYYPLFFKASHFFDCGVKSFKSGENVIVMDGALSQKGVPIFGFVVCETFKSNFRGAELDLNLMVKPFVRKDKTAARIPDQYVLVSEAIRNDARPAILFEDRFAQYMKDESVQANGLAQNGFGYYLLHGTRQGNGSTYVDDPARPGEGFGSCRGNSVTSGYSRGTWTVPDGNAGGDGTARGSGALMLNYSFGANVQVEAEITYNGGTAGIRFGGTAVDDGYELVVNGSTVALKLNGSTLQSAAQVVKTGNKIKLRVKMFNGRAYCYFGFSPVLLFGGYVSLARTNAGVCGVVATSQIKLHMFSIGSLDRYEPMEKMEVIVDGKSYTTGEIKRNVGYDEYGLIQYSGINELNTRLEEKLGTSLDYEFNLITIPGFAGAKNVTVRLLDAGIWYATMYCGDASGCSIIWAGDSESFLNTMNRAVGVHGAKGIGLWTLGQEDPRVFDMVPDVVPPYR